MTAAVIIHGSFGNPNESWFPWLKSELQELGCKVIIPLFPTPEGQNLENWSKIFDDYELEEDSIVIGHSLGPPFLLNVIEKLDNPIRAAFFVSGFTGLLGNPTFDKINRTFVDRNFDWEKIKKNCKNFYVFHSDNDPYVPIAKAQTLAKELGTEVILVKDAGHFNEQAGYTTFPLLLEKIKDIL